MTAHAPVRRSAYGLRGGFTLIELMVAIAVLSILAIVAYPNLQALIHGQRLTTATNEIITGVQMARGEAIRRNARVGLCSSANGTSCAGGAANTAWSGWVVMADSNGDSTLDEVVRAGTFNPGVSVKSGANIVANTLTFRADGLARKDAAGALVEETITVCVPKKQPAENRRLVKISSGSNIATTRSNGAGIC